ncbi:MAG: hypothetical protein J6N21_07895 [Butyrivibrio sp.]|nr:hypothetical protein [Butyrivibrio sp.]
MKKIKKIWLALLLSILLAVSLTGCSYRQSARINLDITIKRNQKVDVAFLVAVLKEMAEYQFFSTEDLRDMKARGWDYKLYSEADYLGYVFTIQDQDLNSIVNAVDGVETSFGGLSSDVLSITNDGMSYTFQGKLFDDDDVSTFELYKTDFLNYGGCVNVVLHLPEKASSSNATFVSDDGKTLTWDLLNTGVNQQMRAEFRLIPSYYIYIMVALAVIVPVLLLIATILRVTRKKKEAKIAAAQEAARRKAEYAAAVEAQKKAVAVANAKKKAMAAAQAAAARKSAANTVPKKPGT